MGNIMKKIYGLLSVIALHSLVATESLALPGAPGSPLGRECGAIASKGTKASKTEKRHYNDQCLRIGFARIPGF